MRETTFPELIAADWRRERPDLQDSGLNVTLHLRALSMEIDHQFAKIAAQEGVQLEDMLCSLHCGGGANPIAFGQRRFAAC